MIRLFPSADPDDVLPYWFDATDFAADEGSTVSSMALAVDDNPDGALTLGSVVRSGSVVSFYPLTATAGVKYTIRCRCTLANGSVADLSRTITGEQH